MSARDAVVNEIRAEFGSSPDRGRLGRGLKKGTAMCSPEFGRMFCQVSKAALIDALWCSNQLGTNESVEEITTSAARNIEIALTDRGDRIPKDIAEAAKRRIDADPPADDE